MKSIGIDIGAYSIKIAELTTTGKSVSIRSLTEIPLSSDPNSDNQINIIEALRNLAAQHDSHSTTFVLAISQDKVTTRQRFFPFSARQKILKSLPIELEDEIPFDFSNAIFDARFTRQRGNITEVLACACPKGRVESLLQLCHDAGIEPMVISMESAAHANNVEAWDQSIPVEKPSNLPEDVKPAPDDAYMLVDIGHKKTIINIFRRGRLIGCRTISWGGKNLIEAVARKYGVMYQEALRETQSKAFILVNPEGASRDQQAFSDTLADSLAEMLNELKLIMMEVSTDYNINFSSAQLTGGASRVKNLPAYFTQILEVPCSYFDPFQNFNNVGFEKTPIIMTGSSVAIGLALEGLKRAKNPPLNFRKNEFGLQSASWENFWEKWKHTVQISGVAIVAFCIYAVIIDQVALNLSIKSEEQLKVVAKGFINKKTIRTKDIEDYIKEQNRNIENQVKLAGLMEMNSALDIIKKLSQAIPAKTADIYKLDIEKQSLILEGTVKDSKQILEIERGLKTIALKNKVNRTTPKKARGAQAFAFEIEVDRNIRTREK